MATCELSESNQNLYCFTQTSNSVTYHDHITERLKDFSQGVTCDPPASLKGCFTSLQGSSVSECVVSSSYIALLLEDGRVCRIRYSEEHPPLPSNMTSSNTSNKEKSDDEAASTSSARSLGSRSASPRPDADERPPSSALHSWGSLLSRAAVPSGSVDGAGSGAPSGASLSMGNFARRGRIWLRRRGMGRSLVARWPIVPASEVPDDLVDQAMAVLQGKSREAVIRELQRTSLDVNQAVNNLLSREDDDGDDEGETGIIRLGFPPGEELLSLLSSGLTGVAEEELEEVLGRSRSEEGSGGPPGGGRESRVSLYEFSDPLFQNEIRSLVSLGDGAAGGGNSGSGLSGTGSRGVTSSGGGGAGESSSKRLSSSGRTPTGNSKRKKENSSGPLLFDNAIEWWSRDKDGVRFKHIAELYSELLAIDTEGRLHSWAWSSSTPSKKRHPREAELLLENEKIKLISAKILRASVVTESGKLATWLDSSVSSVSSQLEQKAHTFTELNGETISSLHVSELLSAVVTESGKIYWWGVLPLTERKQALINSTERIRMYKYHNSGQSQEALVEGCKVCLRTSPIFSVGAKAIHMKGTQIQCGVLQEDVMSPTLSEKCQFHVIPSSGIQGPSVSCDARPVKSDEQEDMETERGEGQLSLTINVHVGSKRRHSDDSCPDGSSTRFSLVPKSEVWSLRDVIFTDHVTNVKVGSVVKLDGNYVAVHYPALNPDELSAANLDKCRLLRKDELVPAKEASPQQAPYFNQETPRKLRYPSFYNLLTMSCDLRGVHALFTAHSQVDYVLFNLNTSEFSQNGPFGELNSQYLLKQGMPLRLVTINSNLGVVIDQHGGMFPISKNSAGNLRDLQLLNLPPVVSVGVGVCSSKNSLVAVSFRQQLLIPLVLKCDYSSVKSLLEHLKGDPSKLASTLRERCSGGCNVFHVLASLSKPQDPQASSSSSGSSSSSQGEKRGVAARTTPRGGMLREIMKQAMALASGSGYPHPPMDWTSDDGDESSEFTCSANTAADILHLLSSLEGCEEVLTQLLQQKNLEGYTPFMAAVAYKAYNVARMMFDVANQLSEGQEEVTLLSMVYPSDCHPDDNPVFVICRSDTCSFTWTGEEHIHQDIFECRTCGLTGSLCCCTECAYTCHRGHDCSFKRVSPTAYCDCWEMCKCKALAPSSDYERKSLLAKLLDQTNIGTKVNSSQEHLLGMLASMVARQAKEQAHWSGRHLRSISKQQDGAVPVSDLLPPKFAQKALTLVLEDWACVKAALMGGNREGPGEGFSSRSVEGGEFGTNMLSTRQSTTIPLDAFTYIVLTKLQQKSLDSLLSILVKEMGPERKNSEAVQVAERFVRSVVRVFTVCHTESVCVPSTSLISSSSSSMRKKSSTYNQLTERAQRVFTSLTPLAVRQLVPMARAIILPVAMGISKPVDPNCMSDRRKTGDDIFRLPPASLLRVPTCEDDPVEGGGVDNDAESEMGDGEEEMTGIGVPTHDASSTATTGSNLLYLSDQESSDGEDLESGGDDLSMEDSHQEDDGLLDPPISHRVTLDSHWAMPSSRLGHTSHHHGGSSSRSISRPGTSSNRDARNDSLLNMGKSSTLLAQVFSLLIRQLTETLDNIYEVVNCPTPPYVLPALATDPADLYKFVWAELEEVWVWLFNSMDMLESQLRFGSSMSRKITPKDSPSTSSKRESASESMESRKHFFAYILTLLRGQFCEMEGMLPAVDVANMEHLAWTFDALFYLLQNIRSPQSESQDSSKSSSDGGKQSCDFFRRSTSTLCLGLIPPSPFDPMADALPVAEKPQLMDGAPEKEILFGQHYSTLLQQWPYCPLPLPPLSNLFSNGSGPLSGIYMWPKQPKALVEQELDLELSEDDLCGWDSHRLAASVLVGRWSSCLKVFSTAFMDTVGRQSGSVLSEEQIFEHREKEFRREMDHLRTASHKDILLEVERAPDKLLSSIFTKLNQFCERQNIVMSQGNSQPLCVHKVKVSFDGEPGEGSGVLRSLFTAASEAIVSEEPLPTFDFIGGRSTPSVGSIGKTSKSKDKDKEKQGASTKAAVKQTSKQGPSSEAPLFYQPGKAGFYAPRVGTNTPERLNAYRNIGRLIGLCLLFSEVMPLPLCRHVFKFILIRTIRWHDLAFFDPGLYESLRKMILDSRKPDGAESLSTLALTFAVSLRPEEGGETVELIPNGGSISVTPSNVLEYVKKYAMLRMIKINSEPLQQMRKGLHEVLPGSSFSGLSAEDFRLLLCGCPHIDIDVVRGITLFHDESRKEQDTLSRFKNWFWSVLERMTQRERQDLLYFWTSSPVLPASVDSYQPAPSVTIRPPDDQRLPTANTCISRLYIPLYSSKAVLKARLLTAIKTKTFGFV